MGKISYRFNSEKFANAVAYLCQQLGPLTKLKVAKLLYFADKRHLRMYGRPIVGDRYCRLPKGPIPSRALNIINGKVEDKIFESQVDADRSTNHVRMTSKGTVDFDVFSDSELKILDEITAKYGHLNVGLLIDASHDATWKNARDHEIDYRLFVEDLPRQKKDLLIELMEQDQEDKELLELS